MKITNEIREYVTTKVDSRLPKPTSKDMHDEVYSKLKYYVEQHRIAVEQLTDDFIKKVMEDSVLEGCEFRKLSHRMVSLSYDVKDNPYVAEYVKDHDEYEKFKSELILKVLAIISVKKDMDDIDNLINDCLKKEGIV